MTMIGEFQLGLGALGFLADAFVIFVVLPFTRRTG